MAGHTRLGQFIPSKQLVDCIEATLAVKLNANECAYSFIASWFRNSPQVIVDMMNKECLRLSKGAPHSKAVVEESTLYWLDLCGGATPPVTPPVTPSVVSSISYGSNVHTWGDANSNFGQV